MAFLRSSSGSRFLGGFSPASLSGLELWLAADKGVLTDGASQFTSATTEYLSVANNANVRGVAAGWWRAIWVKLDTDANFMSVFQCSAPNARGYALTFSSAVSKFYMTTFDGSANDLTHNAAIVTGTWYFIYIHHDGTDAYITVDDANAQSAARGYTVETTNAFEVGRRSGANYWDGPMQHLCGGDGTLSTAQVTWLYNSGAGRHRGELDTGGNSVSASQCKFWNPLSEKDGERRDQIGTNHLTDNATVTSAAGLVEGPAVNNSPVSTWQDQSGNGNDAVQSTHAAKPIYKTGQINGQPAVVFDDAASQCLILTGMTAPSGGMTFNCAYSADDAVVGTDQSLLDITTGRVIFNHVFAAGDLTVYYETDYRGTQAAAAGDQVVSWVLAPAAGAIYRDGATLDTGLAYTERAIGGSIRLGSRDDGAARFFSGGVAEATLYSAALSAAQLLVLHNYFKRYGTF